MIDVSNPDTIPVQIENAFLRYVDALPSDAVSKISEHKAEYTLDVQCAIEDHMGPFKADALYDDILFYLESDSIRCFHATRILNDQTIWNNGLTANSWDKYSLVLEKALHEIKLSENTIERAVQCVQYEYNRKYSGRTPQICFFSSLSLLAPGDSKGYDQFCQNVGGELARWALKDKMPDVYQGLKAVGFPAIVEVEMPFSDIADYKKDSIAYQFITYYAAKNFWGKEFAIEFDGCTQKDINPSQIIEIHHYGEEVLTDYE